MWLLELKSFRTKKKSSDAAAWVAWSSMLALVIVLGAVLTATQLAAMTSDPARFFNVRVPTVEDFRAPKSEQDVSVNENSLFVYVGREHVAVGSVKSVMSPKPGEDVVLFRNESDWRASFVKKISQWKRARELFPAFVFAFSYDDVGSIAGEVDTVSFLTGAIAELNREVSGGKTHLRPVPVMVGFDATSLASSEKHHEK
jgi:hypothetical protein